MEDKHEQNSTAKANEMSTAEAERKQEKEGTLFFFIGDATAPTGDEVHDALYDVDWTKFEDVQHEAMDMQIRSSTRSCASPRRRERPPALRPGSAQPTTIVLPLLTEAQPPPPRRAPPLGALPQI